MYHRSFYARERKFKKGLSLLYQRLSRSNRLEPCMGCAKGAAQPPRPRLAVSQRRGTGPRPRSKSNFAATAEEGHCPCANLNTHASSHSVMEQTSSAVRRPSLAVDLRQGRLVLWGNNSRLKYSRIAGLPLGSGGRKGLNCASKTQKVAEPRLCYQRRIDTLSGAHDTSVATRDWPARTSDCDRRGSRAMRRRLIGPWRKVFR